MSRIIEYVCTNVEHWPPHDVESPFDTHAGTLGYCPMGVTGGHDWCATGGTTLPTVRDWLSRPDGVARLSHSVQHIAT